MLSYENIAIDDNTIGSSASLRSLSRKYSMQVPLYSPHAIVKQSNQMIENKEMDCSSISTPDNPDEVA